jgi:hypothetical protein
MTMMFTQVQNSFKNLEGFFEKGFVLVIVLLYAEWVLVGLLGVSAGTGDQ